MKWNQLNFLDRLLPVFSLLVTHFKKLVFIHLKGPPIMLSSRL